MNAKLTKALRKAAGYRNQSATPGMIPFPGVARVYTHPVYTRPLGKPMLKLDAKGQPVTVLVPVTKPARLDPKCTKGIYRTLKRLTRKGLLHTLGAAYFHSQQPKEAQA